MRLKSYFSGTVEAAMELARQELGEDALLVNARPSTPETQSLGAFEVVFGVLPKLSGGAEAPPAAGSRPQVARLAQDVAGLKREIECMAQSLRGARMFSAPMAGSGETALYRQLIEAELDAALARHVEQGTPLQDFFEVDATLGRPGAERAVVALIGPPGAGKTATLVKLAARYGLTSRRPAHILSADVHRVAATDQLRALASILGVGCDVIESPLALAQALEEHRSKDFVFIDTPGLARDEMEDGADLAHLIASRPEIDTHLVLPASMKPADLARVIDCYGMFRPGKLLFTRLDETERYGALVTEAARRSLPVSFLTAGQRIPEDLEPATKEGLVSLVLGAEAGERKSLGAGA